MAEYIEREALIVRWKAAMLHMAKSKDGKHPVSIETLIEDLELFPAADVEPVRHGRWVKDRDGDEYCENCSRYMPVREITGDPSANDYCPNCGAKMDATDINVGDKEEE